MKKEKKPTVEGATEAALLKQFKSDIGSKAIVEHHTVPEDKLAYMTELRGVLSDVAQDLQRTKIVNPGFEYLGSFSVHVYASEVLRQFEFVSLTNPHKTTHPIADAAMHKLTEDVSAHFTGNRRKLRSGW